jgi:major membrane immunogen (membrane-anchored lipoprotein)
MKKSVLLNLFLFLAIIASAQQSKPVPCSANPVYRQFDFWIGEWEAFNAKGIKSGDSKIERMLDSCVILENWTSTQQGYAGKSYNTFNSSTGKWQQYWVDNTGGVTEFFDGRFEEGKMIMQTFNQKQADGSFKITKMTFSKISDDKVRQFGQSSVDGGATWKTDFDLEYRRKK